MLEKKASKSYMEFSDSFDVEDDSDMVLQLFLQPKKPEPCYEGEPPYESQEPVRSYWASKMVLKKSDVLKKRLQRSGYVDDASISEAQGRPLVLKLHVEVRADREESDIEAMHVVLRSLYNAPLSAQQGKDKLLLLKAFRLGRFYLMPNYCMTTIAAPLLATTPGEVDVSVLAALYSPSAGLLDSEALSKFICTCKERLLDLFGDVPAVLTGTGQLFRRLPHAVVLAWLKEDNLKVHSENCVMLLLSAWVNSPDRPPCGKRELEELAHHVRVQHLSHSYLHSVLPHLRWFRGCACMASLPQLLQRRGSANLGTLVWKGPPAWLSAARARTSPPRTLTFRYGVNAAELQHKHWNYLALSPGYLNGFWLGVELEKASVSAAWGSDAAPTAWEPEAAPKVWRQETAMHAWGQDVQDAALTAWRLEAARDPEAAPTPRRFPTSWRRPGAAPTAPRLEAAPAAWEADAALTTWGPEAVTLACYAGVRASAMESMLGSWDVEEQAAWCSFSLRVGGQPLFATSLQSGCGYGTSDVLRCSGATVGEVIAPFLVNGQLRVAVTFSAQ